MNYAKISATSKAKQQLHAMPGVIVIFFVHLLQQAARMPGFKKIRTKALIFLIKKTGLFDEKFYLHTYPDVTRAKSSAIKHYVIFGEKNGYQPMALFSPTFYEKEAHLKKKIINRLLHFYFIGRHLNLAPSPLLSSHLRSGRLQLSEELHQYLLHSTNVHALSKPCLTLLSLMSASETTYFAAPQIDPQLLTNTYWKTLQPKQKRTDTSISVIIPVYKNMQLTLECIHSVLTSNNKTPFELIVINDHSPDHTLSRKLQELSNLGLFTLLTNKKNLGFVKTVNLGMRENTKTDVVLLNSDTRVFHDWLDRLKKAATQNNIASVTPLSNNATICSYPTFLQDNDNPAETLPHEIDLLAKAHNSAYIEAPTGVGFCMYITRAALNAVGLFDAESFGKGYGEENDWCQRSIAQGLKNLITTDTYVWHHGGASFQGAQKKLIQRAMKTLNSLHPNYHKDVHAFIKADPLFTARQTLDIYRLKAFSRQENALIVVHNRGGGTARNVHESITQLQNKGVGTFILQPHSKLSEYICISHPKCKDLPNLESLSFSNLQPLKEILLTLHITSIHVHSTLDFKDGASDSISELARIMNIDLNIVIHDYESICPRVNLVGTDGKYCGEKSISQCAQCLSTSEDDIIARRQRYDRLLTSAARVYAPSQDAANRVQRYFPKANIQYMAHSEIEIATKEPAITARAATSTLKVLVIGALSSIKGYDVLLHCARFAKTHSTPLQFYLMGYSINDKLLEDAGVVITGKYLEPDADYLFSTIAPDAVLLPSIWPETYSYTLSLGLRHGCPIFAFDIGAIPERLKKSDLHDGIMPLEWSNNPEKVINYITACLNNLHQKNYSLN